MTLLKFARFFLYAAVICICIVLASTFFPFIGGKYYFFRLMVELALMCVILSWAFEDSGEVERRVLTLSKEPVFLAVSAFTLMFLLSSVLAFDSHAAFWSNYERGEGGFQMLHYYLYFSLLAMLFDKKEHWVTLFKVSLGAAAFMIFYGFAAAAMIGNFVGPYRDGAGNPLAPTFVERAFSAGFRFQGSLGNPAYVAPYLLFSMFYALWLWLSSKKDRIKNILFGLLLAVFLLTFILSQTRGAFLGLMAAIGAYIAYIVIARGGRLRKIGLIAAGAIVLVGGILWLNRYNPAVQKLPGSRFLTISVSEDSAQTRIWTWNTAWKGFKERPFFGWGPENFSAVFDRHFDTRHYVPGRQTETWFDRAHSVIFDYLTTTGIFGLFSYLGIFGVFYWQFFKDFILRHHGPAEGTEADKRYFGITHSVFLRALLFVIPIAYLVQGLILFDVLPIIMNWFIVLAFMVYLGSERHAEHAK